MASSCPACPAETEEIKSCGLATAGRGPLGEWARIKTGSRAEFVAQVVEEAGSPGECVCACARAASSPERWRECCWAYKWRCNPSVISELSPLLVELKPTYRPLERPGRSALNRLRALFIFLLRPARASVRLRAQFQHSSRTGRRLRLVVKLPPFLSSTNRRRGTTRRRRDGSALGVEPVSIKHHPHQTRRKLHW